MTAVALDEASIFNAAPHRRRDRKVAVRAAGLRRRYGPIRAVVALLRVHHDEPNFLASPPPEVRAATMIRFSKGRGLRLGHTSLSSKSAKEDLALSLWRNSGSRSAAAWR